MNLHGIVSGAIGAVNPHTPGVVLKASAGYTTATSGKRTPLYDTFPGLVAQVQQLTTKDLRQLESLNIQGSQRAIYLYGVVQAIVRVAQKGGDLLILPDGTTWLTTAVLEQWPDWCKVAVTLQNGA